MICLSLVGPGNDELVYLLVENVLFVFFCRNGFTLVVYFMYSICNMVWPRCLASYLTEI
jgi:hypothetical protein